GKRGELLFVVNKGFLVGGFFLAVVEGDGREPFAVRDQDLRGLGEIVVDDQVERNRVEGSRPVLEGEVLDPDARMKEFRLMPRDQQAGAMPVGDGFAGLTKVLMRQADNFLASGVTQACQRLA